MTQAAQKILNAFDQDNLPFWAVYDHQKVLFKCNQEDEDICASSEKLKSVLEFLEDGTKSYTVLLFSQVPDGGFKKYQTVNFKKLEPDGYYTYNPYRSAELVTDRRGFVSDRESRMFEAIEKLAAEVTALKAAQLEDDEEPEIEQQAESNILGAIFNNDQMKAVIAGLVANMAGKFISGGTAPIALAGTDITEDDRINTAIEVLKKHDPSLAEHLEKLAIMSENETNKFKMLISML